jgi:predicted kinase
VSRLIHLNGPPGIGKSTLARRYADAHPGVLDCDVDVLRTLVGGWRHSFRETGALVRTVALAMIGAHLRGGHDVVLPQLLVDPAELARFEACADAAGAGFVEILLTDTAAGAVARFHGRGPAEPGDAWHDQVRAVVAAGGGDELLRSCHRRLGQLAERRADAVVIATVAGDVDAAYRTLADALETR